MLSRRIFLLAGVMPVLLQRAGAAALPDCEWCGASEAPSVLASSITLAGPDETGERLVLRGTVLAADGRTPVPGVRLYTYHTNAAGLYAQRGNETGNGRRHGHLRGWLVSDAQGHYEIRTIRPGHYPDRREPAHIHMTVKEAGRPEYWIDDVLFKGDPLLTREVLRRLSGRGGPGIATLQRLPGGEWLAYRDIILAREGELK